MSRPASTRAATKAAASAGRRFLIVVLFSAFFALLMAGNLAAPLYAGFARRFNFSTATLTFVFAVYALVLIPALVVFGQLSDRFGRRRMIAAGILATAVGLTFFTFAQATWWLFTARALQGLGQGMLSGAATAALVEAVGSSRRQNAALLATLAQAGGSAVGVLLGGILGQWAPRPYQLPFLVGLLMLGVVFAGLRVVPQKTSSNVKLSIQRPRVPAEIRGRFIRVGLTAAAAWAVAGSLFLSVIPSYAAQVTRSSNLAFIGTLTALMLGSSCFGQLLLRQLSSASTSTSTPSSTCSRVSPGSWQALGLLLLAGGLLCLVLAHVQGLVPLLPIGSILAGLGHGIAFLSAQTDLTEMTPDDQRAAISGAFYVCIYIGVALPVIGIGIIADRTNLFAGISTFAAVTGLTAIAVAASHLRHRSVRPKAAAGQLPSAL